MKAIPATGEVTLRFGDSEVDRTATAGTRVAGGSRDIGRASAATVSAQTAAGGVRVYPTDTAQQFLERYFKSVDPLAVVTVSSDRNFTVTSPFIAGATLYSMETAIYHSNGNYHDGDPMGKFHRCNFQAASPCPENTRIHLMLFQIIFIPPQPLFSDGLMFRKRTHFTRSPTTFRRGFRRYAVQSVKCYRRGGKQHNRTDIIYGCSRRCR